MKQNITNKTQKTQKTDKINDIVKDLKFMSTTEILNLLKTMHGDSLIMKLMDLCETYDIDPQFLGDILEEDKIFKEMLHDNCYMYNNIKDPELKYRDKTLEDLDIW